MGLRPSLCPGLSLPGVSRRREPLWPRRAAEGPEGWTVSAQVPWNLFSGRWVLRSLPDSGWQAVVSTPRQGGDPSMAARSLRVPHGPRWSLTPMPTRVQRVFSAPRCGFRPAWLPGSAPQQAWAAWELFLVR